MQILKRIQQKPHNPVNLSRKFFFLLFADSIRPFFITDSSFHTLHKLGFYSLLAVIFLYNHASPIVSQTSSVVDREENRLDESIRSNYEGLNAARDLLSLKKIQTLPANTIVRFIGQYPNRTGIKIIKYNVIEDPRDHTNVKTSEEKSILIEFSGSVLSRVEYNVKLEETGTSPRIYTKIVDETPLDETINDLEIYSFEGVTGDVYPLSNIQNSGIQKNRNNFKKNFYLKLLQDSLVQLNLIIQMQKQNESKNNNQRFNTLKKSLNY
jgi:hypothetical protein